MADIDISTLRDDILDRMDNMVITDQLPESLRIKLKSTTRVTRAMNQAVALFIRDADPGVASGFSEIVSPSADSDVGSSGVSSGVKTYLWPDEAYSARADGGVLKVLLDGDEFPADAENEVSVETLRYYAGSDFYGPAYKAFGLDLGNKRIYAPKDVSVQVRVVGEPEQIQDDDTYGTASGAPSTLPLEDTFLQTLSQLAFQELVKMATNFQNRQQVVSDTMPSAPTPEQQQEPEQ